MRKIAFAVAVLFAFGWAVLAWQDQSAQDAADYATKNGPLSCTGAGR
jgi:hypothetical protein